MNDISETVVSRIRKRKTFPPVIHQQTRGIYSTTIYVQWTPPVGISLEEDSPGLQNESCLKCFIVRAINTYKQSATEQKYTTVVVSDYWELQGFVGWSLKWAYEVVVYVKHGSYYVELVYLFANNMKRKRCIIHYYGCFHSLWSHPWKCMMHRFLFILKVSTLSDVSSPMGRQIALKPWKWILLSDLEYDSVGRPDLIILQWCVPRYADTDVL